MNSIHHSFNVDLAAEYGIEKAILIHHFQYWIRFNRSRNKNIRNGKCWSYQSKKDIAAHLQYFTYASIKHHLAGLVEQGVLITGNFNRAKFDKTLWYAFADEKKFGVDEEISNRYYEGGKSPLPDKSANSGKDSEKNEVKKSFTKNKTQKSFTKEENHQRELENHRPIPNTKKQDPEEPRDPPASLKGVYIFEVPSNKGPKSPAETRTRPEAKKEAQHLLKRIQENFPKFKQPNLQKWENEMRLLNERDQRPWDEIVMIVEFATRDTFWMQNILSPSSLRKHYDKLYAQLQVKKGVRNDPDKAGKGAR